MQLEDRQIIHRSLDRDFPFGRTPAIFWAVPVTQDGLDGFQVERRAAAVDQRLKHLVHVRADLEDQVSAIFDLIVGVLVAKPGPLLLVEVEGEAETGVDPTLANLAQPPYSPMLGQGVCDLRQNCGVRDSRKTISLLGERDAGLTRLAGNVFRAVQHGLGGEARVAADLDRQMTPVAVEDVKRVVVDIGELFLSFDVVVGADSPYRGLCPADEYEKQPLGDLRLGQIFFGQVLLALTGRTVDHGNVVALAYPAQAAAEPTGEP